jgi:hypothetical protein
LEDYFINDKSVKISKCVGHEFDLNGYMNFGLDFLNTQVQKKKYKYNYMFSCISEEMREKIIPKIDSEIIFMISW